MSGWFCSSGFGPGPSSGIGPGVSRKGLATAAMSSVKNVPTSSTTPTVEVVRGSSWRSRDMRSQNSV